MRPNGPNHVWAVDFVHDKLSNNRPYKMLTVVDEYTRQALAVHVAHKMSAADCGVYLPKEEPVNLSQFREIYFDWGVTPQKM